MKYEHPFLARGFRPFFLGGAAYTALSILIWIGSYAGPFILPDQIWSDASLWHGHEMIFGFTMAIAAGFLLTAVANWTGGAPARHIHLGVLCLIWLAGRVFMNVEIVPSTVASIIDLSFIPALAISLAVPLIHSRNKRNFVFLFMLTILFLCNLALHLYETRTALYIAIIVIMAMISLIGGRIIPAFTVAALRRKGVEVRQADQPKVDIAALFSLLALVVCIGLSDISAPTTGFVAFVAAIIHAWRMRLWHGSRIWNDPMLWILQVGYGWLVVGLFMLGLSGFGVLPVSLPLHALTAGAIGSMTLGMMCRVALGHTGRNLIAGKAITASFLILQAAVIIRIAAFLFGESYQYGVLLSGILWTLAFGLYVLRFTAILFSPRPDGKAA